MSVPRHWCRLRVFADFYQFYICDPGRIDPRVPEDWSDQDIANRAKAAPGVVVICPIRNMDVPVQVGVWDTEPHVIFDHWQHVIEAPLTTTGRIEIDECTGEPQAGFAVEPGDYTIRALYRGLDTLSKDGLEAHDFYEIQIWPSPCASGLRVIRHWD